MVTVPPAWPFFLKIPFCSQVFDKPFSHCCCLVTGRVAFPRDRDLGPVCSEADLEGLFFEGLLSVADAGGSVLTSRSCPVCGMEQWEGRRKGDSRRSPGSEGSGSV